MFVFTSADKDILGQPTGWYLPEGELLINTAKDRLWSLKPIPSSAAHPYYLLSPHYDIDFAAPAGPNPPLDQASVELFKNDAESVKFLKDDVARDKLAKAFKLTDVKAEDYAAIFYPGG